MLLNHDTILCEKKISPFISAKESTFVSSRKYNIINISHQMFGKLTNYSIRSIPWILIKSKPNLFIFAFNELRAFLRFYSEDKVIYTALPLTETSANVNTMSGNQDPFSLFIQRVNQMIKY